MSDADTMRMFLSRALDKIVHASTKKHTALRAAAREALEKLSQESAAASTDQQGAGAAAEADADRFFEPFRLACETGHPRIMETSLDCLQKLIAYGYLRGRAPDPHKPDRPLLDAVVDTICGCAEFQDDAVQLQIIKALLTTVTSSTCEVHESSLLHAVRTCYTIHLVSKNLVNQTTAKATLTQMVNIIFQRMEAKTKIVVPPPIVGPRGNQLDTENLMTADEGDVSSDLDEEAAGLEGKDDAAGVSSPKQAKKKHKKKRKGTTEHKAHEVPFSMQNYVESIVNKSIYLAVDEAESGDPPKKDALEATEGKYGWCAACGKPATMHCPQTEDFICSKECRAKNIEFRIKTRVQGQALVANGAAGGGAGAEDGDESAVTPSKMTGRPRRNTDSHSDADAGASETDVNGATDATGNKIVFRDVLQKDAFLVFRALCKLSMKPPTDNTDMRTKTLALELLLSLLENSGPIFRTSEEFISAVKQYLCMSLLRNCVSPVPAIFRLSLSIFVMLLVHFKDYLKAQIGVFFNSIFFKILESNNSTYLQKMMVLQVLSKICQDAQTIVDIFVNYDCDVEHQHIFERMVNNLSRIAQRPPSSDAAVTPQQDQTMKQLALRSLVHIIRSLVNWSRPMTSEDDDVAAAGAGAGAGPSEARRTVSSLDGADDDSTNVDESTNTDTGAGSESTRNSRRSGTFTQGSSPSMLRTATTEDQSPEVFEKQRRYKIELGKAVQIFNEKPSKGMQYLKETGLIENTPDAIARFLHTAEGLDKEQIGDFLGEGKRENIDILYKFTDQMDFTNLEFDDGIRTFLSGFRLPGEAQKIDRMMEKFAERFCSNNEGVFANADTAYILAYSVIMLNTDLHSSQIKKKMTLEEFIRNNRGINDGNDLDRDFLVDLYNRILTNEIRCNLPTASAPPTKKGKHKREDAFQAEAEGMVEASQALFKEKGNKRSVYHVATHIEHTKPMFEVCWCPMLAGFSVLLEDNDDAEVVEMCLEGFKHAIRISSIFQLDTERNAFVTSLAKFTFLHSEREMKQKNIESIKVMIEIALTEGNHLAGAWRQILACISQLDRLQLIGSGQADQDMMFQGSAGGGGGASGGGGGGGGSGAGKASKGGHSDSPATQRGGDATEMAVHERRSAAVGSHVHTVEEINSMNVVDQIDQLMIDRVFVKSAQLSQTAVVQFVTQLCEVSLEEISLNQPRIFSLQKIVEIAYYNMGRIRLVWSQIWQVLAEHFKTAGCHHNLRIAMYAIDSLRQLAMKFLEKDELSNFSFQNSFLQPFDHIIHSNQSLEIRELIIRCLSHMILARVHNIKSGWKSMFNVFTIAATDTHDSLVHLGFEMVEKIVREYFPLISSVYTDCVKCLLAYANNELNLSISVRAIEDVYYCAQQLAQGNVRLGDHAPPAEYTDDPVHVKYWFSVLSGLSGCTSDLREPVRKRALDVMFSIVNTHGGLFSTPLWELIFRRILLPVFDGVLVLSKDHEWMQTTLPLALTRMVEIFRNYYTTRLTNMFDPLMELFVKCITSNLDTLAQAGVKALFEMLTTAGEDFTPEVWDKACASFQQLFDATTPRALSETSHKQHQQQQQQQQQQQNGNGNGNGEQSASAAAPGDDAAAVPSGSREERSNSTAADKGNAPMNFRAVRCQCIVQLLLIQTVNDLTTSMYSHLNNDHMTMLLEPVHASFTFAHDFNSNMALRVSLWKAGFMNQLPNLLKQETNGVLCYLRILLRLYNDTETEFKGRPEMAEPMLINQCTAALDHYLSKGASASKTEEREIVALTPIVILILKGFVNMTDEQFARHLPTFYPKFCDLMRMESSEVRKWLADVFATRIAQHIPILEK